MSGPTVFISYSHRDERWKNKQIKNFQDEVDSLEELLEGLLK